MFEDIIGGVNKERNVAKNLNGDGIVSCPNCGSHNIIKGKNNISNPTIKYIQECECASCWTKWSIVYKFKTNITNNYEISDIRKQTNV